MMGEGYDHKYLSVAAIFRAFKSPLPYEQFIGRILRAIPESEVQKAEDNIGSVVAHELLFLDQLWEYYKTQLQESNFIDELTGRELPDSPNPSDLSDTKVIEVDFGQVSETGVGNMEHSIYMETDYIIQAQKERQERQAKILELSKLLDITNDEASDILNRQKSNSSELKRPDVILKRRKKTTDTNIRQVIVPELLLSAGVEINGTELKELPILRVNTNGFQIELKIMAVC